MNTPQSIGVVPIGDIPDMAPRVIAAHISACLNLEATVLKPIGTPSYALDKQRLQFDVGPILQNLESKPFKGVDKIIGVLSVDIFLPVFTHVFGEARQGGRVGLVSLFRLKKEPPGPDRLSPDVLQRAAKVALHELCHLYDLAHCENNPCLMHFSGSLEDLDLTPFNLCRYCTRFFKDALALPGRPLL